MNDARPADVGKANADERRPVPEVGDSVAALRPGMSGRYLVTTQGSTHVWDLDLMTYTRLPTAASRSGAFDHDGTPQRITRVESWPAVGHRSLVWFDDPAVPWLLEHYRVSSTIADIRRIPDSSSLHEDTDPV